MVTRIDVKNTQELREIRQSAEFDLNYVIVSKKERNVKNCCDLADTEECICALHVFRIRPYTFEFLRAIQPFFEIVVFSNMHYKIIESICNHLEDVLNEPIKQYLKRKDRPKQSNFSRRR